MNHQKSGRKLERNRNQRRALVKSLAEGLVLHGRICTTEARAKEMKSRIDRLVNLAKEGIAVPDRRVATVRLLKQRVSGITLDRLCDADFLKKFGKRTSGFTRVVKLAPRKTDGAKVAILEFVD
ncbi:MAG: 50S ribosomal protein L17 [Candidatus Moraniibacteriota bacterium]|nr:MAG: 50S ribosomal protein L17 [Candidatus Moranbacteria bacterium]